MGNKYYIIFLWIGRLWCACLIYANVSVYKSNCKFCYFCLSQLCGKPQHLFMHGEYSSIFLSMVEVAVDIIKLWGNTSFKTNAAVP